MHKTWSGHRKHIDGPGGMLLLVVDVCPVSRRVEQFREMRMDKRRRLAMVVRIMDVKQRSIDYCQQQ
jgi:hypothetical protein